MATAVADQFAESLAAAGRCRREPCVACRAACSHRGAGQGLLALHDQGRNEWRGDELIDLLWLTFLGFHLSFIATLTGWFTAGLGRRLWTVHGVLRAADVMTPFLTTSQATISLIVDLGIGVLFGLAHGKARRSAMVAAVAPIWDGNETWPRISRSP